MFTDPVQNVLEFGFLPGQSVADLGSGAGHYAMAISKAVGEKGLVYAIDLQQDLLIRIMKEAEEDGRSNIRIIRGDIQKPKGTVLGDSVVDGAVFSNILFQLEDKAGALGEAFRILKPGGKVGVVEWSDLSFLAGVKGDGQKKVINEEEAKELFSKSGFAFERSFDAGEHHYGLVFKKPNSAIPQFKV